MKMREEIDALRTMGFDPIEVLVLPRVIALVIAVPMLTFLGSMAALYGGGLVCWLYGGMTPGDLPVAAQRSDLLPTFAVGMIKAPFMALVIGLVACVEGFEVRAAPSRSGADHRFGGQIDLSGDRARRPVRHVLCRDRDVTRWTDATQPGDQVRDLVVGFGEHDRARPCVARCLSRRDPRLRRRLRRRQVGADAHHRRAVAQARGHDRGLRRRSRRLAARSGRRSSGAGACCFSRARCSPR